MAAAGTNGGFALPLEGEPVRLLASRHDACRTDTWFRLPRMVPPSAIRRVVCDRCAEPYDVRRLRGLIEPAARRGPHWLTLPVGALAVVAALSALQGEQSRPASSAPASPARAQVSAPAPVEATARLVSEREFQLALPAAWQEVEPPRGAAFAAVAVDGGASATVWIERDRPFRLATHTAPDARSAATAGVELIRGTYLARGGGR